MDSDVVVVVVVGVGVGVDLATAWLHHAPVHLVGGAIGVDSEGRTNVAGVSAAGDVTATWDDELGRHVRHEHWASAIDQAQRVSHAITGTPQLATALPSFWSDQYDRSLQYVGSHDAESEVILRGDLTEPEAPLLAFFLRAGRLAAVLSVNNGKDLRRAQRLIGHGVSPALLADRPSTCASSHPSSLPSPDRTAHREAPRT